jgi:hypothetical protein
MDLSDRIIATLQFFDLQKLPLTLYEVYAFLIGNEVGYERVTLGQTLQGLSRLLESKKIECKDGYYTLPGQTDLVGARLAGYRYGIKRERRIKHIQWGLRYLPFIRGVALVGSQAFGLQREQSDIDLLVITDSRYMWLARTIITAYFQILGMRRHGKYIANRFCLNHYIAGPHLLEHSKNLYTAMEYSKSRPLYGADSVAAFQNSNAGWITALFPNQKYRELVGTPLARRSRMQYALERLIDNTVGKSLEKFLEQVQKKRIKIEKDIVVSHDELSFHPDSKQNVLIAQFFALQKQKERETV